MWGKHIEIRVLFKGLWREESQAKLGESDISHVSEQAAPNSHPFSKTLKTGRNSQNQLCQKSEKQSKIYRNEENQEKNQLPHGRKAMWHFYLPLLHPLPQLSSGFEDSNFHSLCDILILDSEAAEHIFSETYCVCSKLSVGFLKRLKARHHFRNHPGQ